MVRLWSLPCAAGRSWSRETSAMRLACSSQSDRHGRLTSRIGLAGLMLRASRTGLCISQCRQCSGIFKRYAGAAWVERTKSALVLQFQERLWQASLLLGQSSGLVASSIKVRLGRERASDSIRRVEKIGMLLVFEIRANIHNPTCSKRNVCCAMHAQLAPAWSSGLTIGSSFGCMKGRSTYC